ncbi:MAG TPA: hypothetical protein VM364_15825 [Vicinamibacterales bacterium]|nr:hypothetical protein [Vicinamibacterales bacterium]
MARLLAFCCIALFACPASARAEWHLVPMGGLTMLARTSMVDPEGGTRTPHLHAGGTVAWLSRGLFGLEGMVVWTPDFFEGKSQLMDVPTPDFVKASRAVSLMGNVIVTLPQRWTEYGLRPFVSGGVGLMHAHKEDRAAIFTTNANVLGVNIGGGAVGFLSHRTGIRFDVRYHSTLNTAENAPAFGAAHLRYLTASVGIVLRRGVQRRF